MRLSLPKAAYVVVDECRLVGNPGNAPVGMTTLFGDQIPLLNQICHPDRSEAPAVRLSRTQLLKWVAALTARL
jgi:hypothetical protein